MNEDEYVSRGMAPRTSVVLSEDVTVETEPVRLVRPRRPVVAVAAVDVVLGLALVLVGANQVSAVGAVLVAAGVALALGGPVWFWFWARVREVRVDQDGIHLRGLGLAPSVPWSEISEVRAERLGPTTFLVARTASGRAMPLLSPFRRRFARLLGVDDPRTLLVVRTVDFSGRDEAFGVALRAHVPPTVRLDWTPH